MNENYSAGLNKKIWAANTLRVENSLLVSACYPRTNAMLAARGYELRILDVSELQKAEAALTCMSLID